jgi:hypothetical protein
MNRRYEWSSKGMDRKHSAGFLDDQSEMTKNVVYGLIGVAAGAIGMHFAMKHNVLGLGGRPAAPAPQVPASTTASTPAQTPPAAGVRLSNFG